MGVWGCNATKRTQIYGHFFLLRALRHDRLASSCFSLASLKTSPGSRTSVGAESATGAHEGWGLLKNDENSVLERSESRCNFLMALQR